MNVTDDFKQKVAVELLKVRQNFEGTDYAFATKWGLTSSAYSLLKNGRPTDKVITGTQWVTMGRELGVSPNERVWNIARTEVFETIQNEIMFCKQHSKAMILVDDCEIGKTTTAKYLSKTVENCFYLDCSQAKTKRALVRAFAKCLGVEQAGTLSTIKDNIKYYLRMINTPVVIMDEAGDLDYEAFLELKEFWNATDGYCGWYMMGADGLRNKLERGIANQRVGYREIFSRYSGKFRKITPREKTQRQAFYRDLITAVLSNNCEDKALVPELVKKCLAHDATGEMGGLRRAEALLILSKGK